MLLRFRREDVESYYTSFSSSKNDSEAWRLAAVCLLLYTLPFILQHAAFPPFDLRFLILRAVAALPILTLLLLRHHSSLLSSPAASQLALTLVAVVLFTVEHVDGFSSGDNQGLLDTGAAILFFCVLPALHLRVPATILVCSCSMLLRLLLTCALGAGLYGARWCQLGGAQCQQFGTPWLEVLGHESIIVLVGLSSGFYCWHCERLERREFWYRNLLAETVDNNQQLLQRMLPASVCSKLQKGDTIIAEKHDHVSLLFVDLVGFSSLVALTSPVLVVHVLDKMFNTLDALSEQYGVYKVETVFDTWVGACGIQEEEGEEVEGMSREERERWRLTRRDSEDEIRMKRCVNATKIAQLALAMTRLSPRLEEEIRADIAAWESDAQPSGDSAVAAEELPTPSSPSVPPSPAPAPLSSLPLQLRVGIHSGSVMAGVIGRKLPRYRLFGDTVNTTARMCTNGTAGRVHVSPDIAAIFSDSVVLPAVSCRDHALRSIKGKGSITTCYLQPDDAVLSEPVRPKQQQDQQTAGAASQTQGRQGGRQAPRQQSAAVSPGMSRTALALPTIAHSAGSSSSSDSTPPPMHARSFLSPAASLGHPSAALGPLDAGGSSGIVIYGSASSGIHRLLSLTTGAGLGAGGAAAAGGGKDKGTAALFARGSASVGLHQLSFADLVHRNTMLQREEATDDGEGEVTDSGLGDDRKGGSASDGSPAFGSSGRRIRAQRGSRGSRSRLSGRIGSGPQHHRHSSRARDNSSSSITRSRAQTEAERMQAAYSPITAIRSARVGPRGRSLLLKKKLPSAAVRLPVAAGAGSAAAAVIPEDGSGGEGEGEDDSADDEVRKRERRRRRMSGDRRREEGRMTAAAASSAATLPPVIGQQQRGSRRPSAADALGGGKAADAETKEMDAAGPLTIVTSSPPAVLPLRLRPSHHRARTLGHQQMALLLPHSGDRRATAALQLRTDGKRRRMKKSGSLGADTGLGLAGELMRRGGREAAAGLLSSEESKEQEPLPPLSASSQHLPLPGTLNDAASSSSRPPHGASQSLSVSASSQLRQPGSPSLDRRSSVHSRSSRVVHAMAELNREKEEKGIAAAAGGEAASSAETTVTVSAFTHASARAPLRDRKSMPDLSRSSLLSGVAAPALLPSSDMDGLPFHLLDPDTIRLGPDLSFADYPDLERKYQQSQSRRVFHWLTTRLSLLLLAYLLLSVMDLVTRTTGIADPAQPTLQGHTAVSRFISRLLAGLLPGLLLVWLMANTRRPRVLCLERPLARLFPLLSHLVLLLLCVLAANLLYSDVGLPYPGVDTWCAIIVLCGLASSQFRLPFVHSVALTLWCTACYLLTFVLLPLAFPFTTVDRADLSLSVVVQCLLFCLCMLCLFTVISRMQEVRARERFLTLLAIKKQRVDTSALLERLLPKNVIGQLLQMGRAPRGDDGAVSGQTAAEEGSTLSHRVERASTDLSQHSLERRFSNAPHDRPGAHKPPLHSRTESSLVALPSPQPSLASTSSLLASMYPSVTVMQADVCSFTPLCARSTPQQVITMLNSLFLLFDSLTDLHRVYKVETIGDAVLAVCGAPTPDPHHAFRMCELAIAARDALRAFTPSHDSREPVRMRFGLHTGRVVGGVVGMRKMPRFHIYGQTVSGAGSMEQQAEPMTICISADTWRSCRLHDRWGSDTLLVRRILEPGETAGDQPRRRREGQRGAAMSGESEADEPSMRTEEEESCSDDDSEQQQQQGHIRRYELVGHRKPPAEQTVTS